MRALRKRPKDLILILSGRVPVSSFSFLFTFPHVRPLVANGSQEGEQASKLWIWNRTEKGKEEQNKGDRNGKSRLKMSTVVVYVAFQIIFAPLLCYLSKPLTINNGLGPFSMK